MDEVNKEFMELAKLLLGLRYKAEDVRIIIEKTIKADPHSEDTVILCEKRRLAYDIEILAQSLYSLSRLNLPSYSLLGVKRPSE